MASLSRILSENSRKLYEDAKERGGFNGDLQGLEGLLGAIFVLNGAHEAGRINEADKVALERYLACMHELPLDEVEEVQRYEALCKLTIEERELLETVGARINQKENSFKRCCICRNHFDISAQGITCSDPDDKHFSCRECFAEFCRGKCMFNDTAQMESLRRRGGKILCPLASELKSGFMDSYLTCISKPFPDQDVARVLPPDVYESFQMARFKYVEHEAFESFVKKYGGMVKNTNDILIETIWKMYPDARMCGMPTCGYGPVVLNPADCDNLAQHDGQIIRTRANGSDVRYNNHCPICSWFSPTKAGWLKWDGKLHEQFLAQNPGELNPIFSASKEHSFTPNSRPRVCVKCLKCSAAGDLCHIRGRCRPGAMRFCPCNGRGEFTGVCSGCGMCKRCCDADPRQSCSDSKHDESAVGSRDTGDGEGIVVASDGVGGRHIGLRRPRLCRYYSQGHCRDGTSCTFLHVEPMDRPLRPSLRVFNLAELHSTSPPPVAPPTGIPTGIPPPSLPTRSISNDTSATGHRRRDEGNHSQSRSRAERFRHVEGAWSMCGGNLWGMARCSGFGNCTTDCHSCGSYTHWSCCGDSNPRSTYCLRGITREQATMNANICRQASVRATAVRLLPGLDYDCTRNR